MHSIKALGNLLNTTGAPSDDLSTPWDRSGTPTEKYTACKDKLKTPDEQQWKPYYGNFELACWTTIADSLWKTNEYPLQRQRKSEVNMRQTKDIQRKHRAYG